MKKRLVIISISTFFLFSLLFVQFFKIQILEGEQWTQKALGQHEFFVKEPFRRGAFYSNASVKVGHPETPQPFVLDVTKFHLYIDPQSIPEEYRTHIAENLSLFTEISPEEFHKKSRSRKLAMWLSRETKDQILAWWFPYARKHKIARNALFFITDYQRSYPFGKLLGQVLHTIRDMKDETTHEGLPTGGLEAHFNDVLKGKLGKRKLMRSPLNSLEIDKVIEPPEDGADIYLTINHCLQAIAEEELEKGVKVARAKGGWAMMMDPRTGEILAAAQYPFFDPSRYQDYFNNPEKIEDSKLKGISDAFELGSIMKPITLAIALQANELTPLFDPSQPLDTSRSMFPGRGRKPLVDTSFHKKLNMNMALQKSSNVYMAQVIDRVVDKLGKEWYRQQLIDTFGFNCKTGIELPGEAPGLVPRPGKMHPNGTLEWSLSTPYSLAMGHNMMATSIQMLRSFAVFANGGYLVQPTLVRKIVKGEEVLLDQTQRDPPRRVLSEEIIHQLLTAMKYVMQPGGTGHRGQINGYTEAGKTGTSEKIVGGVYSHKKYVSSFIGFAPASFDPAIPSRFVLIVTIDEPAPIYLEGGGKNYHGGRCAAPVFREIGRRTLEYLGVTPDDPFGYPASDPRYDPEKAEWILEVRALKTLYDEWNK